MKLSFKSTPGTLTDFYATGDKVYLGPDNKWVNTEAEAADFPTIGHVLKAIGDVTLSMSESLGPDYLENYSIEGLVTLSQPEAAAALSILGMTVDKNEPGRLVHSVCDKLMDVIPDFEPSAERTFPIDGKQYLVQHAHDEDFGENHALQFVEQS